MAIQVCFCAPKAPRRGGVGTHRFCSTPVRGFKQANFNGMDFSRLAKPAELAGLQRNFDLRQQVVDAVDQFPDRMPIRRLPQILGGEMNIYLRARDHPVTQ